MAHLHVEYFYPEHYQEQDGEANRSQRLDHQLVDVVEALAEVTSRRTKRQRSEVGETASILK
jgi:hypothetical protein